jgi:hypothetical protein
VLGVIGVLLLIGAGIVWLNHAISLPSDPALAVPDEVIYGSV